MVAIARAIRSICETARQIHECVTSFIKLLANAEKFAETVYQKALISGYLTSITPCRTTFQQGSKLTQTSSSAVLPGDSAEPDNGICFRGAETEYLLFGTSSEKTNQKLAFSIVYMFRMVMDIIPIAVNPEVQTFVAGVFSLPVVGAPLALIAIVIIGLAEPLIDTLLLVYGQDVPLIKTTVYLTPSGLVYLTKDAAGLIPGTLLSDVSDTLKEHLDLVEQNKAQNSASGSGGNPGSGSDSEGSENTTREESGLFKHILYGYSVCHPMYCRYGHHFAPFW